MHWMGKVLELRSCFAIPSNRYDQSSGYPSHEDKTVGRYPH